MLIVAEKPLWRVSVYGRPLGTALLIMIFTNILKEKHQQLSRSLKTTDRSLPLTQFDRNFHRA